MGIWCENLRNYHLLQLHFQQMTLQQIHNTHSRDETVSPHHLPASHKGEPVKKYLMVCVISVHNVHNNIAIIINF